MRKQGGEFSIFLKAAFFMLSLVLILGFLASMKSGVSMFNREVMSVLSTIFIISLCILGVMTLAILIAAISGGSKDAPVSNRSTLIKDNTLRYEKKDENGRKKKVSFSIANIDEYLSKYSELYVVRNARLYKSDKKAKANANTLMVSLDNGKTMSMRQLNNSDPELYNEICALLDRIKDKDSIDLSFRMRKYATEEDLILAGRKSAKELKDLSKRIKNKEIRERINTLCGQIYEFEDNVIDHADRVRKLYDHYLPMLEEIVENYITMEGHDAKIVNISDSRSRLSDTLTLLSGAFASLEKGEQSEDLDQLDADVQKVNALLEKSEK